MMARTAAKQKLRVLITVKTYPIPSSRYDELVCTAGVTETGDLVRLYPINFRDLPFSKQYRDRGMHFTPDYPTSCGWPVRLPRRCWTISE